MNAPSGESDPRSDVTNPSVAAAPPSEDESPAATDGPGSLLARHAALVARIRAAARAAGRAPDEVTLLAVSKTFGADAVLRLAEVGQRAFGESYLQEALRKMAACRDQWAARASGRSRDALEWHFIGPVQSNKTRAIAEHFDWVHSIDRERIALRLSEQRPGGLPPLSVCIQVDVSGESTKSGCAPDDAPALAHAIAALPRLRLRGLMAIPAPTDDPALQRAQFARLRAIHDALRAAGLPLDTLSMGMSGDLEAAIGEGATIVRVGTALFGSRPKAPEQAGAGAR